MTYQLANRVQESIAAPSGSAAFSLGSPVSGCIGFASILNPLSGAAIANGDTVRYAAFDSSGNSEEGLGTYTTGSPNTLVRTVVDQSSAGAGVHATFSGTVTLICSPSPKDMASALLPLFYSAQTPTTGFSITIPTGVSTLQLTPASTLASGTITLPASPVDGQEVYVTSTYPVTALTVSPNSGQSVVAAPTTLPAQQNIGFQYHAGNTTWYCTNYVNATSGSGTVNTGTAGQVAYYAANGTAVSGEAPGLLSVTATGSTTARTLATRFAEQSDVLDYGAAGNGVTNDTLAFNAAVATGKPVFLPTGSYPLTASGLTGNAALVTGFGVTLPVNGFNGVTNQGYWTGASGIYFAKNITGNVGQAAVVINATNNQTGSASGESGALYVGSVNYSTSQTGIAGIFQTSSASGNASSSLCAVNAYSMWNSGSQGSGSVAEFDVYNGTSVDDSWPISNATAKTGLLIASNGPKMPSYALNIGVQGTSAPFRAGIYFGNSTTANYDVYAAGASSPRWSVDASGNITGQTIYGQTLEVGTFSASPAATITAGTVTPTASAMPGSLYIDGNQSLPGSGQLWVNTSTGTGTQWGQVPTLNKAASFTVSVQAPVLGGAYNVLDDGAGDATIAGSLFAKSGVDFVGSSSGGTTISAPSSGSTMTWTLPSAAPTTGQILYASGVSSNAVTLGWESVSGTGTVTSVSFTGGLISVATSTTTPALTVAGTSGGIPYFSSGTTWASSGALTQYGVVYGGGAGAAPGVTAVGTAGQPLLSVGGVTAPAFGSLNLGTAGNITGLLPGTYGGTGVNNGSNTITVAGNVTHAGAYTQTFTAVGNTSLTLPTSGTVTALGNTTTGSGSIVLATSPTLVTPVIGAATGTSLGLTGNATASTFTANTTGLGTSQATGAFNYGSLPFSDTGNVTAFNYSANSYAQVQLVNPNTGSAASADFIIGNSNTTNSTYYVDIGMNGSGYSGTGSFNQPNYGYVSTTSVDLAIGTTTSNAIHFVVNNGATDAMSISSAGEVSVSLSSGTIGNFRGALIRGWDSGAVVAAGSYVMCLSAPIAFTIASMTAQVIAPSSGCSFQVSVYIGTFGSGTVVTGLNSITVNNTETTTTATGANTVTAGTTVYIVIGTVTGTSSNAVIQLNTVRT